MFAPNVALEPNKKAMRIAALNAAAAHGFAIHLTMSNANHSHRIPLQPFQILNLADLRHRIDGTIG